LRNLLAKHAALPPAGQEHDEGDARSNPDGALNREVHIILLSLKSFHARGTAPQGKPVPRELAGQPPGTPPFQKEQQGAAGAQPDCSLNQSCAHRMFLLFRCVS